MRDVFICDAQRTPFGRYGGVLSSIRTDDLAALPLRALIDRNTHVDWCALDDVILGCANQAGEDNRNVARMAALLAGLPVSVPGATVNRLCGSGMDAVAQAARAIRCGEAELVIAGGVEGMSRAPYVMGKSASPFARDLRLEDTTMGWRFVNPGMQAMHGTDSMPQTAENLARECGISREDQDRFALGSHAKALAAQQNGYFAAEITRVVLPASKDQPARAIEQDEHPRSTSLEALARLKPVVDAAGTITAGNASGLNDGACALLLASDSAVVRYSLRPMVRVHGMAVAGVAPRVMGMGPHPATLKLLKRAGLTLDRIDVIELNEAFAAQALAVLRQFGLADDDARVNPNGGAIALGHPLGASGARLVATAAHQLHRVDGRFALCTMCIGVGQGIALLLERYD
jgi:3-oxoadipyl-CoA thiolase